MFSVLSRFIPPPAYITMPCIGLDISDTSLKYVMFEPSLKNTKIRELAMWGDVTVPAGIVTRGEVLDAPKLVAILKEFKEKTKAEFVRVSLPEEGAYLFETEIKHNTPLREVRGLLEFRLEENVPIPSREVFFDYAILPTENDAKVVNVSVVAYPKQTVQAYYDACLEAGLRPITLEVEAQAMARAVVPKDLTGSAMVIDFGKTRTGVGIVHKGVLMYTSTIDIGGNHLSEVLRKALGEKTEPELTEIKNNEGLSRGVDSSEVRDALMPTISVIRDELVTRMQYWHLRTDNDENRRIKSVILCGGSANLKGISEYFSETLGVPTIRGNVWENALSMENSVPPIDRRYSYGYAGAIGLALKSVV